MNTTVKLLASAIALCVVAPDAYAISADQAVANLKGAAEFEQIAHKNYAASLRAERESNAYMMNAFDQYGPQSKEVAAAAKAHQDAFALIAQRRREENFANGQLQAAAMP